MRLSQPHRILKENQILFFILIAGLLNGLLYVFVVPPWQHYDEPTQFEYAWWLANRGYPYKSGDFDQAMHREVAASMLQHGFFERLSIRPNLVSQTEPVWIGIPQYSDPPLYYALVSLPLRLVQTTDITFQLYLARLVSLVFFLLTIVVTYRVMKELVSSPENPLLWAVPLTVALLPGFTDLMTAVNNDVGATFLFSLFIWGCVRILHRGYSTGRVLWVISSAAACILTKNTVQIAIPLAVFVLILAGVPRGRQRWVWGGLGLLTFILLVLGLGWGDAAQWYRMTSQVEPTRSEESAVGSYGLDLFSQSGKEKNRLAQPYFRPEVDDLAGKTVTLGALIWADQPTSVQQPSLDDGSIPAVSDVVKVGTEPEFIASQVQVGEDLKRLMVILHASTEPGRHIYYDGIVLSVGAFPTDQIPQWDDSSARSGLWGGVRFDNLVRNPSAKRGWFRMRSWINRVIKDIRFHYASLFITHFADPEAIRWYYQVAAQNVLRTFWAKFGWGDVFLSGEKPYRFLFGITLVGGVSGVVFIFRRYARFSITIWMLAACLLVIWGSAFYRGIQSLVDVQFIPSARYAYPAIVPTVLLLVAGWFELLWLIGRPRDKQLKIIPLLYGFIFVLFNIYALRSITAYFGW